ncbi:MAG: phosphatase PAP2 family protein [Lachnospiraceae bacterium]|nr:phosphatase PAP2 family protein [Lachnospiraceae bacterium]
MEIELRILDFIQSLRTPVGDAAMPFISKLGNAGMIWIILALVLLIIPKTRNYGILVTAALLADVILCNGILKHLFQRVRPCDVNTAVQLLISRPKDFSFPSGHTACSVAVSTVLFLVRERGSEAESGQDRICRLMGKLWIPVWILTTVIAFSRMYLYVHYPTDILGGIATGLAAGYIGYLVTEKIRKKYLGAESGRL